jgi:putative membrane protein
MNRTGNKIPLLAAEVIIPVIYLVGIIGISIPATRDMYVQLTPLTLLISAIVLFLFHSPWNFRFIIAALVIALMGYFIEMLGVHTTKIFGSYSYGPVLGTKIWDTPLIIAINWLILIYCSYLIAGTLFHRAWLKIPSAAALMVGVDLLMEPVAIDLDMWTWGNTHPPFQNYAAWFIVSLLLATVLHYTGIKIRNPVAMYLFSSMVLFFAALNFTL